VARFEAHCFGDEAAEPVEVDDTRQLPPVRGGTGGQQHWILKFDSRGSDCEW
jgi:hypothetical protein